MFHGLLGYVIEADGFGTETVSACIMMIPIHAI